MLVSEYSFTWLNREREERMTRELEWRRRALEREAEQGAPRRQRWFARLGRASQLQPRDRQRSVGALQQPEPAGCGGQVAR